MECYVDVLVLVGVVCVFVLKYVKVYVWFVVIYIEFDMVFDV